jgi:hypothetical protein
LSGTKDEAIEAAAMSSRRSLRLQVAAFVALAAAALVAACDDTFPSALSQYDGDASVTEDGATSGGDSSAEASAAEDSGAADAGDASQDGAVTDGGDAASTHDGGDASSHDGSTDAHFDAAD